MLVWLFIYLFALLSASFSPPSPLPSLLLLLFLLLLVLLLLLCSQYCMSVVLGHLWPVLVGYFHWNYSEGKCILAMHVNYICFQLKMGHYHNSYKNAITFTHAS